MHAASRDCYRIENLTRDSRVGVCTLRHRRTEAYNRHRNSGSGAKQAELFGEMFVAVCNECARP